MKISLSILKTLIIGFLLAFLFSIILSTLIPNSIRMEPNLWFGADIGRVIENMTNPDTNLHRLKVHPLFSLLTLPITRPLYYLLKTIGFDIYNSKYIASQILISISGGIIWILIYLISIKSGLSKINSFSLSLLFLSTSAFQNWWSTPETFPIGSLTTLLPLSLVSFNINSRMTWLFALIGSISVTTSNWISGLLSSYFQFGLCKKFFNLTVSTLILFIILVSVQKSYLPSAGLPFELREEIEYLKKEKKPIANIYQFFIAPVVPISRPEIKLFKGFSQLEFTLPTRKNASHIRIILAICWVFLLINGILSAAMNKDDPLGLAMLLFIFFQFILHSFYGDSAYLYSAHYVPILILLSGKGLAANKKINNRKIFFIFFTFIIFLIPLNLIYLDYAVNLSAEHLAIR